MSSSPNRSRAEKCKLIWIGSQLDPVRWRRMTRRDNKPCMSNSKHKRTKVFASAGRDYISSRWNRCWCISVFCQWMRVLYRSRLHTYISCTLFMFVEYLFGNFLETTDLSLFNSVKFISIPNKSLLIFILEGSADLLNLNVMAKPIYRQRYKPCSSNMSWEFDWT